VERETLHQNDLFALAPPMGDATSGSEGMQRNLLADLDDVAPVAAAPVAAAASRPKQRMAEASPSLADLGGAAHGFARGLSRSGVAASPM